MKQDSINILFTTSHSKLNPETFEHYMNLIPLKMQRPIRKFLRWEDAQLGLFGKMLLLEGLKKLGIGENMMEDIEYTHFSRPYAANFDFNITHSDHMVICAISQQYKVGIDLEKIKPINIDEFTGQFTESELTRIKTSAEPLREFYTWWTKKESIIKADGRGLSIPLKTIIFNTPASAVVENRTWHIHRIAIDDDYCSHLATDCEDESIIQIQKFNYNESGLLEFPKTHF